MGKCVCGNSGELGIPSAVRVRNVSFPDRAGLIMNLGMVPSTEVKTKKSIVCLHDAANDASSQTNRLLIHNYAASHE